MLITLLLACRNIEPAPDDLDGLLHYLWANGRTGDDAQLAEAIENLDAAVGDFTETTDGVVSRLSTEEADLVSPRGPFDPADAAGITMLNRFTCTPEQLDRVLIHAAQDELREGTYRAYDRRYTSDEQGYREGTLPELGWEVDIEATIVLSDYSEKLIGGIRRLDTAVGPAFVQITWMPEAAVFDGNGNYWNQDYQLEVYYEQAPRDIVHLYGMWRELSVAGFTSENEGVQRQVLNGLADWDEATAQLCLENRP